MMSLIKAKISMHLKHYTNTIEYFKEYLAKEICSPLTSEELALLCEAYKRSSDEKRSFIWKLEAYRDSLDSEDEQCTLATYSMLDDMRKDLIAICTDAVGVINRHLIPSVEGIQEIVCIYKMKGDFSRYKWEVNDDDETCKEATKAYYEAISVCQWNFEPSNLYLLQIAIDYTAHLNNTGNTCEAINILREVIYSAEEDLDNNGRMNVSLKVETLLTDLYENLQHFEAITDQMKVIQPIELIDPEPENDNLFFPLMDIEMPMTNEDVVISRRYG